MFTVKAMGLALLGMSGAAVLGAVGLGVTASVQSWDGQKVIIATALLAIFAEACFWIGGGLFGLSVIKRRKDEIRAFVRRIVAREEEASEDEGDRAVPSSAS
ncbi:hypothetical protein HK107_04250 [Parvularcula sp. ZS-1/3]|uniref:Uncharacterized protein n=1 Tax=Parvularcula mediterranea TaxID=2732508 RepID=A0A7Y3RK33_9PROT|nr:hypothetical protein [Parvularcula mediterranea]NNU15529.1 hypothetical protein [Parvularcula mediterranea]